MAPIDFHIIYLGLFVYLFILWEIIGHQQLFGYPHSSKYILCLAEKKKFWNNLRGNDNNTILISFCEQSF